MIFCGTTVHQICVDSFLCTALLRTLVFCSYLTDNVNADANNRMPMSIWNTDTAKTTKVKINLESKYI